ncbi:MAG: hypothetical protein DRP09_10905 [Candidatus Thorarchaeota archaeon]|nr:MAG: hypothetical protein DRP09_10905 [Candidatus Thorarchaeota archaeon]
MSRNFVNYVNQSYSGGQNDTDEPAQLRENQGTVVKNAYIHQLGALEKRAGSEVTGDDTGNTAITGQTSWTSPGGTTYFLRSTGTELQFLSGSNWTAMDDGFTTGLKTEFVAAAGKLYIYNGTDNTHSWDGTTTALNSGLVDMGSGVPTGKYAVYWKDYMLVFGDALFEENTYKGRTYISDLGDPDTYTTATQWFDVAKNDGQEDRGIFAHADFLAIGKEKTIHLITGNNPDEWVLSSSSNNQRILENSIGLASHRSLTQVGSDVWYMGSDGLIRSIVKNERGGTPLSGIVCGHILTTLSGLNDGKLSEVAAITFNGRVYFAMPDGSSTFNDLVMVAETRNRLEDVDNPHPWVEYTNWQPAVWSAYTPSTTPQLYYGNGSADSITVQVETGSADAEMVGTLANSGKIDFDYQGPMIDFKQPAMHKTSRFLIVSGESGGNYNIEVSTSLDGNTFLKHGDLSLNAGDLWNTGVWDTATWGYATTIEEKFALGRASKQIMVRQRNNAANQDVKINPFTIAIKPKKIK